MYILKQRIEWISTHLLKAIPGSMLPPTPSWYLHLLQPFLTRREMGDLAKCILLLPEVTQGLLGPMFTVNMTSGYSSLYPVANDQTLGVSRKVLSSVHHLLTATLPYCDSILFLYCGPEPTCIRTTLGASQNQNLLCLGPRKELSIM